MPSYKLNIIVQGRDRASGALGKVRGSLGRIAEFAIGNVLARGLEGIGRGITNVARAAFSGATDLQNLTIALETLAARELVAAGKARTLGGALREAGPIAEGLKRQLRDLALTSPFEAQQVQDAFRVQMAFGATGESAVELAGAVLDTGAALGLTNVQIGRMSYNLAQALQKQDLSSMNLRQLRMTGLDLADVFSNQLGMSIKEVEEALESGEMTAATVSQAFVKYANENFGGSAARMSKTFSGLKSSVKDLLYYSGADLLTPLLEQVTGFLAKGFDQARAWVESGALTKIGEQIGEVVGMVIGNLPLMFEAVGSLLQGDFVDALYDVATIISKVFGRESAVEFLQIVKQATNSLRNLYDWVWELVGLFQNDFSGAIVFIATALSEMFGPDVAAKFLQLAAAVMVVGEVIGDIAGAIVDVIVGEVWPSLQSAFQNITEIMQVWGIEWSDVWEAVKLAIGIVAAAIGAILLALVGVVVGIVNGIASALETLTAGWLRMAEGAHNVIEGVITIVVAWGEIAKAIFALDFPRALEMAGVAFGGWVQIMGGLLNSVVGFFQMSFGTIISAVAGFIEGVIKFFVSLYERLVGHSIVPEMMNAMLAVITSVLTSIVAIFMTQMQAAADTVLAVLGPALEWLGNTVLPAVAGAFDGIGRAIDGVIGWLRDLADGLRNLVLPWWLMPGSATPLELGLRGIVDALREVSAVGMPGIFGGGGMITSNYQTNNYFNQTVHTRATTGTVRQDFETLRLMTMGA